MNRIGVLGYGEVGRAVAGLYPESPLIKDLERDDGLDNLDVLNVCIPYSEGFVDIATNVVESTVAKLVIIHSTVIPGTTAKVSDVTGVSAVHSPVRGMHPDLLDGLKTFVKYVGTEDAEVGHQAVKHLEMLGLKTRMFMPARTTELAKLLSTTYYGVCIAWHGEMKRICDRFSVPFEKAVIDWNTTYKKGYEDLGRDEVVRPILYPPDGSIGGHCVVSNAKLLSKMVDSMALDLVLKYSEEKR